MKDKTDEQLAEELREAFTLCTKITEQLQLREYKITIRQYPSENPDYWNSFTKDSSIVSIMKSISINL